MSYLVMATANSSLNKAGSSVVVVSVTRVLSNLGVVDFSSVVVDVGKVVVDVVLIVVVVVGTVVVVLTVVVVF